MKKSGFLKTGPVILLLTVCGLFATACSSGGFSGGSGTGRNSAAPEQQVDEKIRTDDDQTMVVDGGTDDPAAFEEGDFLVETILTGAGRPLDIMITVDDSSNMDDFQATLAAKLTPLLAEVKDQDWRMGINSTDAETACLRQVIYKDDADAGEKFRKGVVAGTGGKGVPPGEVGLYQARRGLKGCGRNWVREDSFVMVLVISNEDNCSTGDNNCDTAEQKSAAFLEYLQSIREIGKTARTYGLLSWPDKCGGSKFPSKVYKDIVEATGGKYGSICGDYDTILRQISLDSSQALSSFIKLGGVPDPDTIRIMIDGEEQNGGFSVEGEVLHFHTPPGRGSIIKVYYREK